MSQPSGENSTTTPSGGQETQSSTQPAGQPNNSPNTQQTFTQADIDRVVNERLGREKAKYADYDTLKQRAEQWDKFVAESATDQEKAIVAARKDAEEQAWAKARGEFGSKLVAASLTAAAAGRMSEAALSALLAGVDKGAFLTPEGDVDANKVSTFMDGIAPASSVSTAPGGFGQGPRLGTVRPGLDTGRAEYERRKAGGVTAPLIR